MHFRRRMLIEKTRMSSIKKLLNVGFAEILSTPLVHEYPIPPQEKPIAILKQQ